MGNIWKQPAQLCRRGDRPFAAGRPDVLEPLATGSLEEMIRRAIVRVAQTGSPERRALFIDDGSGKVLGWSDIRKLRQSPEFPVEI